MTEDATKKSSVMRSKTDAKILFWQQKRETVGMTGARAGIGTLQNLHKRSGKRSLTRLKTDYIDLYQLHGGTIEDNIDETIEAFEELKQEGVIRYYGISSIRPNVIKEYVKKSNIVSIMMQFSLFDRRPEEWLPLLEEHQISVVARALLPKGS